MLLLSVLHKVDAVNCDVELRYRQWSVWGALTNLGGVTAAPRALGPEGKPVFRVVPTHRQDGVHLSLTFRQLPACVRVG
jgi:hypothetical protein